MFINIVNYFFLIYTARLQILQFMLRRLTAEIDAFEMQTVERVPQVYEPLRNTLRLHQVLIVYSILSCSSLTQSNLNLPLQVKPASSMLESLPSPAIQQCANVKTEENLLQRTTELRTIAVENAKGSSLSLEEKGRTDVSSLVKGNQKSPTLLINQVSPRVDNVGSLSRSVKDSPAVTAQRCHGSGEDLSRSSESSVPEPAKTSDKTKKPPKKFGK